MRICADTWKTMIQLSSEILLHMMQHGIFQYDPETKQQSMHLKESDIYMKEESTGEETQIPGHQDFYYSADHVHQLSAQRSESEPDLA